MTQEDSIEVKVGLLVLVSIFIVVLFVLVMGGLNFEKTYPLFVDFDNPGGLQAGAPVRIAGVKVGQVKELAFHGGRVDPRTGRRTLVRAKLMIERRVHDSIHDDADFYVTTQGVLGEPFLAIDPGSPDHPVLADGSIVKGIDPPRLDLFLAKAFELLDRTVGGLRNNKELISDLAVNTLGVLKGINGLLSDNRERINRTVANVEALSAEAAALAHDARARYVDNPEIVRIIDNVDRISTDLDRDAVPMLKDVREAAANVNRLSASVGGAKEQEEIRKTLEGLALLVTRIDAAAADAQAIVAHVRKGGGTVGALVMDEELYDDLQELVRDLKHNPWKFFWRD